MEDRRTDGHTDGKTDGRTDGGDCNIPDAFLKKRGDNNLEISAFEVPEFKRARMEDFCSCVITFPLRPIIPQMQARFY